MVSSTTSSAVLDPIPSVQTARPGTAARRRFPYPFRAMLAVCSDLDETPDRAVYAESMRFLNTTAPTCMGEGIGLEVANSIYFDMPADQFAYWNTDDAGRAMVRTLIQSGHIDCLHSYGDLATDRRHAGRALDELTRYDCRLELWVDHAVAPSNFGADIMRGSGDVPGSRAYHADLTCGYGIQYVWRGRVTSVIGQGVERSLRGIYNANHPAASVRTIAKEFAKGVVARRGSRKYEMHAGNDLARPARLRDGRMTVEFLRSNPSWRSVEQSDTATGLAEVLTQRVLDVLVEREGACVLYTHLGKIASRAEPFPAETRAALRELAEYERTGRVLVTTTRRLLGYWQSLATTSVTIDHQNGWDRVDVRTGSTPGAHAIAGLDGLSIYVSDASRARLFVEGRERPDFHRNPPDHAGRESISLPWPRLELPPV